MLYYLAKDHPGRRHYLNQWFFSDTLIVVDLDIWKCNATPDPNRTMQAWLDAQPCKNIVLDLSQNSFGNTPMPECLLNKTTLSSDYSEWYHQSSPLVHFFPIWMYMYSQRNNFSYAYRNRFDALGTKTQGVMCLNRGGRQHRLDFYHLMKSYADRMCLTAPIHPSIQWQDKRLPGDGYEADGYPVNDVGVEHPVYDQYAVNVVTETQIDFPSITEKCCKPFIARQIPVFVGNQGVNQFHVDIGFDMFEDLIPWRTWDSEPDRNVRLPLIADFVKQWIDSGTILSDYKKVIARIEKNKQYFHSERFRDLIMRRMPVPTYY